MKEQIEKIINEDINPYLELHQGSCEYISFEDNVLTIRMTGGCSGCPSSQLTLFNGIIPIFKEKLPEIEDVMLD